MFLLDGEDRLAYVSESLANWLGSDQESVTGSALLAHVAEVDRPAVREHLRSAREADGRATRHCACRTGARPDAPHVEIEFVSLSRHGDFDDVLGAVRGETDSRARSELSTARERFGHLFHLIGDAVVEVEIVDLEPIVRSVNPAFEEVFGYHADAVVGGSLNDYIVPDDHSGEAVDFDQRTASGEATYAVVTRQTARGRREFLYRGVPYERDNGGQYVFAIYSDITEKRRDRERLQVLHRIMRHNLRNTLTVFVGMANTIREATDDPAVETAADRIRESALDLTTVSRKAQTAANVLDGSVERDVVDAATQARTVVQQYRSEWPDARLELDVPERLPVAAGSELAFALENVIENALEHGGPSPTVCVVGQTTDREATITVLDDGPGISSTDREPIFEDEEITQLKHGTGLGLWLVKWIVESAGGRVEYGREDDWTAVTIRLPTAADASRIPADD